MENEVIQKQLLARAFVYPYIATDVVSKGITQLFPDSEMYRTFGLIFNRYYQTTQEKMSLETLKMKLEQKTDVLVKANKLTDMEVLNYFKFADELNNLEIDNSTEILDSLNSYVRNALLTQAILKSATDIDKGKMKDVVTPLQSELDNINSLDITGTGSQIVSVYEDTDEKVEIYDELSSSKLASGIHELDMATDGGLARGEVGLIAAASGYGKAQPLTTKIPTPNGIVNLGDLKVGDYVYNRFGKPIKVLGVFDKGMLDAYKIITDDGRETIANDEHLFSYWADYHTEPKKRLVTKTLREMLNSGLYHTAKSGVREYKYSIPTAHNPIEFPERVLPTDPYTLGALIGDGYLNKEKPIVNISADSRKIPVLKKIVANNGAIFSFLKQKGNNYTYSFRDEKGGPIHNKDLNLPREVIHLAYEKSVPMEYKQSSIKQRLELLQGLFDTDGSTTLRKDSSTIKVNYTSTSKQLILDMCEILQSLGYRASYVSDNRKGKLASDGTRSYKRNCYILNVNGTLTMLKQLFTLPSKSEIFEHAKPITSHYDQSTIREVIKLDKQVSMRCIYVDDSEHLYLTDDYIATHNTTVLSNIAVSYVKRGINVFYVSLEELRSRMLLRFDRLMMQVTVNDIINKQGSLNKDYKFLSDAVYKSIKENQHIGKLAFYKSNPQTITVQHLQQVIQANMRASKTHYDVVVLDYPDLLLNPQETGNEAKDGGRLFEELRKMAQDLNVVLWTATQLNRSSNGQEIKTMASVEGSYRKLNTCEFVCTLNRTEQEYDNGYLRLHIDKNRNKEGFLGDTLYFKYEVGTTLIRDETDSERAKHKTLIDSADDVNKAKRKARYAKQDEDKYEMQKTQAQTINHGFGANMM